MLGGREGIGRVENPGPLTPIDGTGGLGDLAGGSTLIEGATVEVGRRGGGVNRCPPLEPVDTLFDGDLGGSMLIDGADWKAGAIEAASGSSGRTLLWILGSSGTTIVGIGGIGDEGLKVLFVGEGLGGARYALS